MAGGRKNRATDSRYVMDISRHLRLWPHARLNAQTGASFYALAYSAAITPPGAQGGYDVTVPLFRTTDRELSPLVTLSIISLLLL